MEKLARTLGCPVRTPFEKEGFQERICSKIHVFLKGDINSNSFDPFSEKFSLITEKIGENCNSIKNLPKMRKNSKFVIFELCQHAIPPKRAFFYKELYFKKKNYGLFGEKLKIYQKIAKNERKFQIW